jgi:uncharacterized protein (TIGR00299 family) protein
MSTPETRRRVLYLDCAGGVAGDMLLSALVEAGSCQAAIDAIAPSLGFDDVRLEWRQARPGGFAARGLRVGFDPARHPHHRGLADVAALIDRSAAGERAREQALAVFRRLAEAEGSVHGAPADKVHFHEVGAVDAVVDILGCCVALEHLAVDTIVCSPLPMGHGTVRCAHGVLPLPAPAVAAMLPGVPVYDAGVQGETVTPTGAALVTTLADRFGPMPSMTVETVGLGAGTREWTSRPNLVRAFAGIELGPGADTTAPCEDPAADQALMVECTIDDMDPRLYPPLIDRLLASGAVDATVSPVLMKKGRPGHLLAVLTPSARLEAVLQTLLRESTTIGCRTYPVHKHALERRMITVETPYGPIPVKVALLGTDELRRAPEMDDCIQAATRHGVPVQEVLAAAAAAADRQLEREGR